MGPEKITVFELLKRFSEEEPSKSVYVDAKRDYTSLTTFRSAVECANFLDLNGVRKGDIVLLRATRSIDTAILFLALNFIGAAAVMGNPTYGAFDLINIYNLEARAKYALSNEFANTDIAAVGNWNLISVKTGRKTPCPIPYRKTPSPITFTPTDDIDSPALILFSSNAYPGGKGAVLSQRNYLNHLENCTHMSRLVPEDNALMVLPPHRPSGLIEIILPLKMRNKLYFVDTLDPQTFIKVIQKEKIGRIDATAILLYPLARVVESCGASLPSLKIAAVDGTTLNFEELAYIEDILHICLIPYYGRTACLGISSGSYEENRSTRLFDAGSVLPLCDVKIVNSNGEEAANGMEGEVIVKSDTVMLGYLSQSKDIIPSTDGDGYFHTGDLGKFLPNGHLRILGRVKKATNFHEVKIPTYVIEEKIFKTGFFKNVAVILPSDSSKEELPLVVAVPKTETLEKLGFTMESIDKILTEALIKIEYPSATLILEEVPTLPNGKVDKTALREVLKKQKKV